MNAWNLQELSVLDWIATHLHCPFLDSVMPWITKFGDGGIFWIAVAVILLCIPKYRKTGLTIGAALLFGVIIGNGILKNVIARIRPYDMEGAMFTSSQLLVKALSDYSFPSGHTLACCEAATVLLFRKWQWGIPAAVIAVLVMFSRLYLYVHYPSDVLAGAILGVLFGILAVKLVDWAAKKLEKRALTTN